ncbi:MAG: ribokinase [Anaerolineae bacterium]|nr:ribokinase [Anaerolineae bacterium]
MNEKIPKICMVGSSNIDLVARVPRLPEHGETLTGISFQIGYGGKGANQSVMAARLGAQVHVVTRVGRDVFGQDYVNNYRSQGIDTTYVMLDDTKHTGTAIILVDEPTGQNTIAFMPGANTSLSPADAHTAERVIINADVLLCQFEVPLTTTLEAFRIAKECPGHHPLTLLNSASIPADPIPEELLRLTDILVANEAEASFLAKMPVDTLDQAKTAAQAIRELGPAAIIITLGSRGVVYMEGDQPVQYVAVRQVQAVDTTGAGDAFVGSLAYLLASGRPLAGAVDCAAAIATQSVTKPGTQSSFPMRVEVLDLLMA